MKTIVTVAVTYWAVCKHYQYTNKNRTAILEQRLKQYLKTQGLTGSQAKTVTQKILN